MDILELIDAYNKCPSNYTHSFTVEQIKELKNLPSEDFYPRLNASGSAFEDIPQKYSPNGDPNLTIQPIQSKFTAHFTMVEARGLAVPHDKDMRESTSFVTREARFCILNDNTNTFIGSMVVILADNSSKIPGNWTFNGTGRYDNAVVCRLAEYEVNSRAEYHKLSLVVEFVGYFSKNGIELQMSCGWAKIPLVSLTLPGPTTLQIMSGSPFDDQKLGNSTAVARFGMRSQAEEDRQIREATLNVTDTNKLSPEFADSLELLPKSCILPHSLVGITKAYRFYLGK